MDGIPRNVMVSEFMNLSGWIVSEKPDFPTETGLWYTGNIIAQHNHSGKGRTEMIESLGMGLQLREESGYSGIVALDWGQKRARSVYMRTT